MFMVGGMTVSGTCPECGKSNIFVHSMSIRKGVMEADIECKECGFRQVHTPRLGSEERSAS